MIGRHDDVAMLNEHFGHAIRELLSKPVVGNKLCIPNHIEMVEKRPRWLQLFGGKFLFDRLYHHGYFRYRPEALLSIEDYLRMKPLKIVGIVRDGSAVVSSIVRRGKQPREVAAYRWRRSIEILSELQARHDEKLLLLSFERLVSEPEETMQAITAHLGLPYQTKMLEGYAHTPNYSNQRIDASKATEPKEDELDVDIKQSQPDAFEKYSRLLTHCVPHTSAPSCSISTS